MKVLEINSVCGIRSTGRICTDICELAEKKGHDCKIGYGRETAPEKFIPKSKKIGGWLNYLSHGFLSRIFGNAGFYSTISTKRFLKWVDEYEPDIIHLHNIHGYYINVALLFEYIKKKKIPTVWTLHDCWPFTGHCSYFTYTGCDNWKTGCRQCKYKHSYPACYGFESTAKLYEKKKKTFTGVDSLTVVTPSFWLAGLAKESFLGEYDVEVIPNGIDRSVFRPVESDFRIRHHLENKKILMGCATSWSRERGLFDFIELSRLVGSEYVIVLVGLTKEQMKDLPENVIGIERTNSAEELAAIYTAADILVNPTYEDNFPTINLEALACGTPVITYDTGGSPESISEGCGCTVGRGRVDEIVRAIGTLSECRNADECIRQSLQYDKWKQFAGYIKLYEKLSE